MTREDIIAVIEQQFKSGKQSVTTGDKSYQNMSVTDLLKLRDELLKANQTVDNCPIRITKFAFDVD
jgi:septum formation topological specificity factor MinE